MTRAIVSSAFALWLLAALVGTAWILLKFGIDATGISIALLWLGAIAAATRFPVWAAVALLLSLRLLTWWAFNGGDSFAPDPNYYRLAAMNGEQLTVIIRGAEFNALFPPLYPGILSVFYWVTSGSNLSPLLLNTICDGLAAWLLARTSVRLGGSPLVGLAYLAWPGSIIGSVLIAKEPLAMLLVVAALNIIVERRHPITYGIVIGLMALTQPGFVPLCGIWLLAMKPREMIRYSPIALGAAAVVLLPWWLRNYAVTGGFIPLSSTGAMAFYMNTGRMWDLPPEILRLPEAQRSGPFVHAALQLIAADPAAYAIARVKGMFLGFGLEHNHLWSLQKLTLPPRIQPESTLPVMQLGLILLWGGTLWAAWKRCLDAEVAKLFLLACVAILTVNIWFEFGSRQRVFLVPLVMLLVATGRTTPRAINSATPSAP